MNEWDLSRLLNQLPDDMLTSVYTSKHVTRKKIWYITSPIAACLILIISAAIYPKLRIRTPEITKPPESVAEVITTTTSVSESAEHSETQPAILPIQTTFAPVTVTANTTAYISTSIAISETAVQTATELPETNAHTETEPLTTKQPISTKPQQTTQPTTTEITLPVTTASQSITVPLWKGSVSNSSSKLIIDEEPNFSCLFRRLPFEQPDPFFELSNQYERLREEYSIPQDFDLTQEPLLDITIITRYKDTAITGCHYTQNGLKLTVSYLKTNEVSEYMVRYAIPLPDNLTVEPENCTVEYIAVTDESEYQALLTDSLIFELDY